MNTHEFWLNAIRSAGARSSAVFLLAAGLLPGGTACGADHDIVIMREVPARTAYREGTPGPVRSSADTTPDDHVAAALGLNQHAGGHVARELNDGDFAKVVTGERGGLGIDRGLSPLLAPAGLRAGAIGTDRLGPLNAANSLFSNLPALTSGAVPTSRVTDATNDIAGTLSRVLPGMR